MDASKFSSNSIRFPLQIEGNPYVEASPGVLYFPILNWWIFSLWTFSKRRKALQNFPGGSASDRRWKIWKIHHRHSKFSFFFFCWIDDEYKRQQQPIIETFSKLYERKKAKIDNLISKTIFLSLKHLWTAIYHLNASKTKQI